MWLLAPVDQIVERGGDLKAFVHDVRFSSSDA